MRFAVAHKTATYLMVGFAYVAMIAGGGVFSYLTMIALFCGCLPGRRPPSPSEAVAP